MLFFPTVGGDPTAAQRLCAGCPVQAECRDEGRRFRAHGIWGGESERGRRRAGYAPNAGHDREGETVARAS